MSRRVKTDAEKARDRRSLMIGLACGGFAILVFVISLVQMTRGGNVAPHF